MSAEEAAALVAQVWFNRVGDGWPAGLSGDDPAVAPLLATLGEETAAALDAGNAAAVDAAFMAFRRAFAPVWRAWRAAQDEEAVAL